MSEVAGLSKYHGLLQLKLPSKVMSGAGPPKHQPRIILPPSAMTRVIASRGAKGSTTTWRAKTRTRKIFNGRADGLKDKKDLYLQKRAKQRQQLEEQSGENLRLLHELDVKECMLEIKSVILGKLAADENHLKGLVEVPGKVVVNFDERVKEVAEALTMLKY